MDIGHHDWETIMVRLGGAQNPCPEPAQIPGDKSGIHRLSGQYRIEKQEESNCRRGIEYEEQLIIFAIHPRFETGQTVNDHQDNECNTGKIVVDKGNSCDKEPGQILSQISCEQEGGSSVLLFYSQIQIVECCRNANPPDERIPESTDALAHSTRACSTGDDAGVIPDRALHDGPLIP